MDPTPFHVNLELAVRAATAADVEGLGWYGSEAWRLDTLRRIFSRQQAGEVVLLVAATPEPPPHGFPVAQLAVDLRAERDRSVAVLWSLAVISHLRGLGIATRLMVEGERVAVAAGLRTAELSVNKANLAARRLYHRLGYRISGERVEGYWRPSGTASAGDQVWEQEDCWVMVKDLA